jgi:hypothetical protein
MESRLLFASRHRATCTSRPHRNPRCSTLPRKSQALPIANMARTPAQQRYADKNRERLNAESRARKQRPEVKAARALRDDEQRNERNSVLGWRWFRFSEMLRHRLTFDYRQLSIVNGQELSNPAFTFVYRGQRRHEHLFERLPL